MDRFVQTVIEYAKNISEEKLCGVGDFISIRGKSGYMYITKANADFANLKESDVEKIDLVNSDSNEYKLHAQIYTLRDDINAICHVHPKWVAPVAKAGATIPTVLDDMAQIVGPKCKTAKNTIEDIVANLKGVNSCLIKDDGCITSGRTMSEAFTCIMVLDKASHCFVSSAVIGKNVTINFLEAKLMQIIYKKKYSKVNQENLAAKEEGEEE